MPNGSSSYLDWLAFKGLLTLSKCQLGVDQGTEEFGVWQAGGQRGGQILILTKQVRE